MWVATVFEVISSRSAISPCVRPWEKQRQNLELARS